MVSATNIPWLGIRWWRLVLKYYALSTRDYKRKVLLLQRNIKEKRKTLNELGWGFIRVGFQSHSTFTPLSWSKHIATYFLFQTLQKWKVTVFIYRLLGTSQYHKRKILLPFHRPYSLSFNNCVKRLSALTGLIVVRLSVKKHGFPLTDFIEILYCKFLTKFIKQIQVWIKSGKNDKRFTRMLSNILVFSCRFRDM